MLYRVKYFYIAFISYIFFMLNNWRGLKNGLFHIQWVFFGVKKSEIYKISYLPKLHQLILYNMNETSVYGLIWMPWFQICLQRCITIIFYNLYHNVIFVLPKLLFCTVCVSLVRKTLCYSIYQLGTVKIFWKKKEQFFLQYFCSILKSLRFHIFLLR